MISGQWLVVRQTFQRWATRLERDGRGGKNVGKGKSPNYCQTKKGNDITEVKSNVGFLRHIFNRDVLLRYVGARPARWWTNQAGISISIEQWNCSPCENKNKSLWGRERCVHKMIGTHFFVHPPIAQTEVHCVWKKIGVENERLFIILWLFGKQKTDISTKFAPKKFLFFSKFTQLRNLG